MQKFEKLNRFMGTSSIHRVSETGIELHQLKPILRIVLVLPSSVNSRPEASQQAIVFWGALCLIETHQRRRHAIQTGDWRISDC
jgi:hypothetical protein